MLERLLIHLGVLVYPWSLVFLARMSKPVTGHKQSHHCKYNTCIVCQACRVSQSSIPIARTNWATYSCYLVLLAWLLGSCKTQLQWLPWPQWGCWRAIQNYQAWSFWFLEGIWLISVCTLSALPGLRNWSVEVSSRSQSWRWRRW